MDSIYASHQAYSVNKKKIVVIWCRCLLKYLLLGIQNKYENEHVADVLKLATLYFQRFSFKCRSAWCSHISAHRSRHSQKFSCSDAVRFVLMSWSTSLCSIFCTRMFPEFCRKKCLIGIYKMDHSFLIVLKLWGTRGLLLIYERPRVYLFSMTKNLYPCFLIKVFSVINSSSLWII